MENVIIEYRDRPEGSESKLNTYSDGFRVIRTILRLYRNYKPLRFFSWLSLLLFILAAVLFVPVFISYLETSLVLQFPTLIVSGFVMLASIQSLFVGLTLETMVQNTRLEFEHKLFVINEILKGKPDR